MHQAIWFIVLFEVLSFLPLSLCFFSIGLCLSFSCNLILFILDNLFIGISKLLGTILILFQSAHILLRFVLYWFSWWLSMNLCFMRRMMLLLLLLFMFMGALTLSLMGTLALVVMFALVVTLTLMVALALLLG